MNAKKTAVSVGAIVLCCSFSFSSFLGSSATDFVNGTRNSVQAKQGGGRNVLTTAAGALGDRVIVAATDSTGTGAKSSETPEIILKNGKPSNPFPAKNQVNVQQEITLTSTEEYRSPYTECAINAVFTGPSGEKMTVPGFWDGDKTWKIRFAAPSEGTWTYVTSCTNEDDKGLHGKTGSLTAEPYTGDMETIRRGRLRVSDDKSYLTYGDGTPFFWLADTHWFGFSQREKWNLSNDLKNPDRSSMFKEMVDLRAEAGYTVYAANLWVLTASEQQLTHNEGGVQWLNGAVFDQLNPEYWKNVDERMMYIIEAGMVPVVGFDWSGSITPSNVEDYKKIVRYAIARYSGLPIIWCVSGEYQGNMSHENNPMNYGRVGQYIDETDPYQNLTTIHGCFISSEPDATRDNPKWPVDFFRGQGWFDFIMNEGGHDQGFGKNQFSEYETYRERGYQIPWLEAESKFEEIWEIPADQTREIAYLSMMNGSLGYSYGAEGIWQATWNVNDTYQTYGREPTPWYVAMRKQVGTVEMPLFKSVFESMPWWKMKPDTEGAIDWNMVDEENYVETILRPTAKLTPEKDWISIYYPINHRAVNGDNYPDYDAVLKGLDPKTTYTAYWFDCQTGEKTDISSSIKAKADGTYALPKPPNSEENDYLFIMRANDANTVGHERYLAAIGERNNLRLPRKIGETKLPDVKVIPKDAQVITFEKAYGTQGENNFYYYSYDKITRQFLELGATTVGASWGWGEYTWWEPSMSKEFITDNLFCAGPENNACVMWVAPEDGELIFDSRPKWRDCYVAGNGATFTIMHNDDKLAEFKFDGKNYKSDSYTGTIKVKAGDKIYLLNDNNGKFQIECNQIEIHTKMYYTPNK